MAGAMLGCREWEEKMLMCGVSGLMMALIPHNFVWEYIWNFFQLLWPI